MIEINISIPNEKYIYFASDFHLGIPDKQSSRKREKKIIQWIDKIQRDAHAIFIVGDVFDFWFEYTHVVPKGYIRFLGKIASMVETGIPIYFLHGNHDMWMKNYLKEELNIQIFSDLIILNTQSKKILIGHGDGLGRDGYRFKFFKEIFKNRLAQWLFRWIHPDIGISMAKKWSENSRKKSENKILCEEKDPLFQYCKEMEATKHYDYYIFGHNHLSVEKNISQTATYINLGEWINACTYGKLNEEGCIIKKFIE